MSTETTGIALRKALWAIQKLADEANFDYDQVNNFYDNVMNEISRELERLKVEEFNYGRKEN